MHHFAATACCLGVRREPNGSHNVHAPHGFDDLFDFVLQPDPGLAPRDVYETKPLRWPHLVTLPWPE